MGRAIAVLRGRFSSPAIHRAVLVHGAEYGVQASEISVSVFALAQAGKYLSPVRLVDRLMANRMSQETTYLFQSSRSP